MSLGKFLDPKNDLAFKRIFGTERNKDILIHFLNDIFARTTNPIEDVTILSTVQAPEVAALRTSIVDVLCRDTEGNRFIIEIQIASEKGFVKRAQYYAAKAYIEQRDKGVDFKDLEQITFLAITKFILFPEKKHYVCHHQMLDIETHERDLKDFSFSFLELPKFDKSKDQLLTMTEKWAYFFKNASETKEEDLEKIIGNDLIIKKAYDELNRFAWTTEDLRSYDSIDMKQSSEKACLEDAFEKGEKQGKLEEARTIAIEMFRDGLSIEKIAKLTKLSIEEIKKLEK